MKKLLCLLLFLSTNLFALTGDGSSSNPFQIGSVLDLGTYAGSSSYWNNGQYAILTSDINLSAANYTDAVIAVEGAIPFKGNFNGNGYTISNLTITSTTSYIGLFGYVEEGASICNLTLANIDIDVYSGSINGGTSTPMYIGGLCGITYGDITNCHITGTSEINAEDMSERVGLLAGASFNATVQSCSTSGTISCALNVGGLVGYVRYSVIESCTTNCTISDLTSHGYSELSDFAYIGGMVGYIEASYDETDNTIIYPTTISNCAATASITVGNNAGKIAVFCGGANTTNFNHCKADGSIITGPDHDNYGNQIGGFCGSLSGESTIIRCYANTDIDMGEIDDTGTANCVGGFCGSIGCNSIVSESYSKGSIDIIDQATYVGGFCGLINGGTGTVRSTINDCYSQTTVNVGTLGSTTGVRSFCGGLLNLAELINCYSTGVAIVQGSNYYGFCPTGIDFVESDCFWDSTTCNTSDTTINSGTPKTIALMKTKLTFTGAGWDFVDETVNGTDDIWYISTNDYPRLSWESTALVGSGTESSPYKIYNLTQFDTFADPNNATTYWSSGVYVKLMVDLSLSGRIYNTAVIAPDMDSVTENYQGDRYHGVFDGNNHVISNLYFDCLSNNDYVALFGRLSGVDAAIKNLGIVDYTIMGEDTSLYSGGLCGVNQEGAISNCYTDNGEICGISKSGGLCGYLLNGSIIQCYSNSEYSGVGSHVGGLVGYNDGGVVTDCFALCDLTGKDYLGGLCGFNDGGLIQYSFSTGTIAGVATGHCDSIGGFLGYNYEGFVKDCYSTGTVSGEDMIGGFCGYNYSGIIDKCYSIGNVSGNSYVGGFCGRINTGVMSECFWDVTTSSIGASGDNNFGATGKTTSQMQTQSTFTDAGWDFVDETVNGTDDIWYISTNDYPRLSWESTALVGSGTESSPYKIYNLTQFDTFADPNNATTYWSSGVYVKLMVDLSLSGRIYNTAVIAPDMDSVTENYQGDRYHGVFDGNNHVISNLYFDCLSNNDYVALFGRLSGVDAAIKNLGIVDYTIMGEDTSLYSGGLCGVNQEGAISNCYTDNGEICGISKSGGLCGYLLNGSIIQCYSNSEYSGVGSHVGGLVGYNDGGVVTDCFALCDLTGKDYLGGLCGFNDGGLIQYSFSTGTIAGVATGHCDSIGGFLGYNYEGFVKDCYSTGTVSGEDMIGGFCGYNYSGIIDKCYSIGNVSGNSYVGGFCGRINTGVMSECFWDVTTSSIGASGDNNFGAIGKTTSQMQTQSTFTDAGWDFVDETVNGTDDIWYMNGYPVLNW